MATRVLLTGGAGFIGSHVAELLLERGYDVRVYDKLVSQVHQENGPRYVPAGAEFVCADMNDRDALRAALSGVDKIVHLAAEVGVGQSMYEISRYVEANTGGTGVLLDLLANTDNTVDKIVVASSMSIYGEGAYRCQEHGLVHPGLRPETQLRAHRWEMVCPQCGTDLSPVATAEDKPLLPTSVYAISKMDQELLCLAYGAAYGVGAVALRYFNSYGPRQALSNPYTGVAAIFSGSLLNGKAPQAFEDGTQKRDFIHVRDVARATVLALEAPAADGHAINVGVGDPMSILDVAQTLATALGSDVEPNVLGKHRSGDIRHCWADTTRARDLLGFTPQIPFTEGITELVGWLASQQPDSYVDLAGAELEKRGLTK